MKRSREATRWALGCVVVVTAARAWASEPADVSEAAETAEAATVTAPPAAATEVEDPNDPTTMASLRRPLFVPSGSALTLGVAALVGGLAGGAWLGRRSERTAGRDEEG
ncbi:MAG: hypothetical protein H6747_07585 [Deltaproteobacteria bacterium]|nr:hypothetical protein [Deltaproteobacteria bacterium]